VQLTLGKIIDDRLVPFRLCEFGDELPKLIAAARQELARKVAELSDGQSATWGFFPELQPDPTDFPACVALQKEFDTSFLALPLLGAFQLQLAFIRLAITEPQSAFGGLHVDASAGIDHSPPAGRPVEKDGIVRVLINLGDQPRELQYYPQPIESLRKDGVDIPKDYYKIIELPPDVSLKSYFVNPLGRNEIHGVLFDSSDTLHAGRTGKAGHFLLSYGGYASRTAMQENLFREASS
jgi:hypothetical protein